MYTELLLLLLNDSLLVTYLPFDVIFDAVTPPLPTSFTGVSPRNELPINGGLMYCDYSLIYRPLTTGVVIN